MAYIDLTGNEKTVLRIISIFLLILALMTLTFAIYNCIAYCKKWSKKIHIILFYIFVFTTSITVLAITTFVTVKP